MFNKIKIYLKILTRIKLQTFLATLGVLVGTASVVAMVSSGQMATEEAMAQFKTLGTDMMSVELKDSETEKTAEETPEISLDNVLNLQHASSEIDMIAPYITTYVFTSYKGKSSYINIIGATDKLAEVIHIPIRSGRFVSIFDSSQPYCVLGYKTYQDMQEIVKNPIGTQIRIGKILFTIIGVANEWPENAFFNESVNESIFVPIKAIVKISNNLKISNIVIRLLPDSNIDIVQTDITRYFKKVIPSKTLFFRSSKQLIQSMQAQRTIFTLLLGLIGGVSLIVGGIGVMNIMLVSVLERKREIGIRLAVGARRRNIQMLFLRQALVLSVMGGLCGVILGIFS